MSPRTSVSAPPRVTLKGWVASRTAPYFIGHRGAAALLPEHSLEGYRQLIDWGVPAIEISTGISSDGVVYCMHDTRLDRTTTLTGEVSSATAATIDSGRIRVPRLGPGWLGEGMPRIPRLIEVLREVAGKAVLCIEAKAGRGVEPMLDVLETFHALDTVMFKAPVGSPFISRARELNLPVFGYLGSPEDLAPAKIATAKATLTHPDDALVVPTRLEGKLIPASVMETLKAVAPRVWVYATHRRSEVDYYRPMGVEGFVGSNVGYLTGLAKVTTGSTWNTGRLPSGLLTLDPYSESQAINWDFPGAIQIGLDGLPTYVTLGDLTPVTIGDSPTFEVGVAFTGALGSGSDGLLLLLWCESDDNPAVVKTKTGYLVRLGYDGSLSIAAADAPERRLASARTQPIALGEWTTVKVETNPDSVTVRVGNSSITVRDQRWRGGYIHVGREGGVGRVTLRDAAIS